MLPRACQSRLHPAIFIGPYCGSLGRGESMNGSRNVCIPSSGSDEVFQIEAETTARAARSCSELRQTDHKFQAPLGL